MQQNNREKRTGVNRRSRMTAAIAGLSMLTASPATAEIGNWLCVVDLMAALGEDGKPVTTIPADRKQFLLAIEPFNKEKVHRDQCVKSLDYWAKRAGNPAMDRAPVPIPQGNADPVQSADMLAPWCLASYVATIDFINGTHSEAYVAYDDTHTFWWGVSPSEWLVIGDELMFQRGEDYEYGPAVSRGKCSPL